MADAAGCFAGFVQFLLLNKNCTRAVDEFYLADKLSPPALVRDAFCLSAKRYGGRFISRGILFCGVRVVFVAKQKLYAGGR